VGTEHGAWRWRGNGEEEGRGGVESRGRIFEQSLHFFSIEKFCSVIGVLVRRTLLSHVRGVGETRVRAGEKAASRGQVDVHARRCSMMELSCGR
jgi:hypothetical protein